MLKMMHAMSSNIINSEPAKKMRADQTKQLRQNYERVIAKCDAECDGVLNRRQYKTTEHIRSRDQCREACQVDMGTVSPLAQTCEEAVESWGSSAGLDFPVLECRNRQSVLIEVGYTDNKEGKTISNIRNYSMSEEEWIDYLRNIRTGKAAFMNKSKKFYPETHVLCPKTVNRTNGLDRLSGASNNGFGYQPSFQTLEFNLSHPRLSTTKGQQVTIGGRTRTFPSNTLKTPIVVTRSGMYNTCAGAAECDDLAETACNTNSKCNWITGSCEGDAADCAGLSETDCKQKPVMCNWNTGAWGLDLYVQCWEKSL